MPGDFDYRINDRYALTEGSVFLTGVQALVRLVLDQLRADHHEGLRTEAFVSGYEGSPLGGYDIELARQASLLEEHRVVHRPAVNEELAATSIAGTQIAPTVPGARADGVIGVWYGKSPGLDRASDAIRHGNLQGAHPNGGALVLVGDDPASKSSTLPCVSELALADLNVPFMTPATPQEVLDLGRHAIALSRASGLWVGLKVTTDVADAFGSVVVTDGRPPPDIPSVEYRGRPFRPMAKALKYNPDRLAAEREVVYARLPTASQYATLNGINPIEDWGDDPGIGLVTVGKTALDVHQALHQLGLDGERLTSIGFRMLSLGMPFPLDPDRVRRFADGLEAVVVVEEKRGFVESAVKEALFDAGQTIRVCGKHDAEGNELFRADNVLDVDLISRGLARFLEAEGIPVASRQERQAVGPSPAPLPLARTPYFCSGCPHNSSTRVPEGSLVGAGIGCHALVTRIAGLEVGEILGLTQMGGEGAQWIGMAPFLDDDHLFQNIGDGTFAHSGSLAIRAAVASGTNITYKILNNGAVAMTGGQDPAGGPGLSALTHMLTAEGVRRIVVTTDDPSRLRRVPLARGTQVRHRDDLQEVQEELRGEPGVTVLIHDQECAAELRRKRKRGRAPQPTSRVFINHRVCEGCGDCGRKSNCLSVEPVDTEFGRKTRIHQESCNFDMSCLDGDCPSFLTVVGGEHAPRRELPALDPATLPEPVTHSRVDEFALRIAGIGGTGIVTVGQILGVAAFLAGRHVLGLDQTGLSQKGGPVVSDLKFGRLPRRHSNKLASGEADLYLAADPLSACDAKNLAVADPDRTVSVVSTSEVPTGSMVTDAGGAAPDPRDLVGRIAARSRPNPFQAFDARGIANRLFGNDASANLLLIGAAYQLGALPLPEEAIEEAISLNGVDVDMNLEAFRRGRQAIADPEGFQALTSGPDATTRGSGAPELSRVARELMGRVDAPPRSALADLLAVRIPDLIAYQSVRWAGRYVDTVARAAHIEQERAPGSTEFATNVAFFLHKLMAYKDEYEVARLSIGAELDESVEAEFGAGAKYAYRLHPPVLRALGMQRKITLGAWFRPVLRMLYAARRLRGTPFDVFGYARLRRLERELIDEYLDVVDIAATELGGPDHAVAIELVSLPDVIRGYEDVKSQNVVLYRERLTELRRQLGDRPNSTVAES